MKMTLIVIALLVVAILLLGVFLPSERSATRTAVIKANPEKVFAAVTDLSNQGWRSSLKEIQILDASPGQEIWVEKPVNGPELKFRTKLKMPPHRFEIEIIDNSSLGGHWIGVFSPYGKGETAVDFSEHIVVSGVVSKLLSYLFFDVSESIETYIADLKKAVE
jgi:hypothetical protein